MRPSRRLRIASAALVFAVWRRPWRTFARLDREGRNVVDQLAMARLARAAYALFVSLLPAERALAPRLCFRHRDWRSHELELRRHRPS
jgi:threonine/homoserine efflux transporter RhtA